MNTDKTPENSGERKQKSKTVRIIRAAGVFMNLGITMLCCVGIGFFIGKFLDSLLGTAPVMILIFSLMGSAASIKVLYDIVRKELK